MAKNRQYNHLKIKNDKNKLRLKELFINIFLIFILIIILSTSNVKALNPPPTVIIENPTNNQTVKDVVKVRILIHDYDYDGITDDIDTDIDNDNRLDLDKDGIEEGWSSSDRDYNNDGIDFYNDWDEDGDTFWRNVDSDDTKPWIPCEPSGNLPSFPSNTAVEIKIDDNRYERITSITRDHWNGTWIITYEWDTTKYSNGEHTLSTHSKLYSNYSKKDSVTIFVDNESQDKLVLYFSFEIIILILIIITIMIWVMIIYIKYRKK
jgi:hypothetical protein